MGLRLALFFGLLSLVAADHHQGVGFVPVGKELVYDYKTIVRSGTLEPALFASEYMLHGRLHVQGGQNSTFVRLSDLKYKVHNGETVPVDHFHWGDDFLPIPKDAVALTYPFVIQYDHDGKAMAIATEQTEHVWSRNVKHAIASIMQLDMTEIEKGIKHSHPFFTPEQTIYGECDVTYNVMPRDDKIIVTKFQDPTSCREGYKYVWLNPEPSGCVAHPEKPMTSDSNRRYVMSKHDDVYCIDRVSATGTIYTYPFRAESDMYFVHVNQTMTLEKTFDIKEHIVVKEQKWVRGLRYIAPETDATTGEFFDFSHGRQEQQNMEEVMQKMRKILSNVVDYIEHNNIEKKIPNIKEYQTINSLLFVLMKFDVHSFEHCFAELKEKTELHDVKMLRIFLNMLPRVGTKASVTFLRNIVRKEKIGTKEAIEMITKLSLFIRHPTEKLLVELEDMMQLGTEPYSMLRRAGILSFATLVHKTFEHEYDDKHVSEALERYVKLFIEKMKSAETYKMKMMWLEGLHNIQFPIVVRYLEPIITGEEKVSEDLRFLALWASMASAVYQPDYAFKLFWPILSDRKLSTEIRVAAYTILMSCPPTMNHYLNMFWLMRHETDEALYHFHYTTLQSLKNTRHTCYREMGIYAKRLLRMSRRPTQNEWANGNYMFDYVDPKYGFGAIYQMLTLTTKDTITMFTEATAQIFNRPFNYFSLFIKIKGVDKDVTNKLPINKGGSQTLADIRSTIKTVSESADEHLHIELITLRQGHVTMVHYFDMSNLNHIYEVLYQWSLVVDGDDEGDIDIMYEFLGQIMVPSDFGTPVVLSMQIPDITTFKETHAAEKTAGATVLTLNGDFHMQTRMHGSYFLEVYNPFNDLWHGVQKIHSFDFSMPLKYEVTFNPEQLGTIRFSVKRWDDEHAFGIRMYANTHTFIYGEHNNEVLRSFDKEAHIYETVTRGNQYKTDFTLFDKEVYDIGSKFEAGVFDCERSVSRGSIMRMIKFMHNKYGKNYATMPFGRYLLTLENIFTYMTLSPNVGSCGFYARFVQSVEKPVDRIDFAFRFNQDFGEEKHIMLPEMKINSRLTMSIKGVGGDVLRSWDFNFLLDMDKGHDDNKFKMTVLRTVPNHDDFKINFEGEKKWVNENVSGKMKLTFTEGEKESFVEVDMKGEMSEDQKKIITDKFYTYDECLDFPMYHYDEVVKHDLSCDIAETSLRKYTYDFKIHNTECPYIKSLLHYKNIWRSNHVAYYKTVPVEHPVEKDHFRLEFEYPVHRDEVDMHVTYPEYSVEYEGLPVNDAEWWNWFGLDNFHYSKYFMMMHKMGLWDTCIIDETTVHRELNDIVDHTVTGDWTVYAEQHIDPSKFVLKVKKVDGSRPLAIRIEEDSHWLEITPHGDKFTFIENGKELSEVETGYHHEEWYSYKVVKEQHDVLIVTKNGMHLDFDGKTIRADFTVGESTTGFCFAH